MKNIIERRAWAAVSAACLIAVISPSLADVGGGSGKPSSPYINLQLPESLEVATRLRDHAARSRVINFTTAEGVHVFGQQIGFAHAGRPSTDVGRALVGQVIPGETMHAVNLSIIRTITVLDKNATTLTVRLKLFPDVSPADLIRLKPSYTELKATYTTAKKLRLPLKNSSGQPYSIVEGATSDGPPAKVITLLRDLPVGQSIEILGVDILWWAIGSVTKDPAYPHRRIFKK